MIVHSNTNPKLTFRLTTTGIDTFTGSWGSALAIDLDAATDYYVRIIGSDFDNASRSYTLGVSTDGSSFTTSGTITGFHNLINNTFETFTFEDASGATILLDNVSLAPIPEPSALAFLRLSMGTLLLRRRR